MTDLDWPDPPVLQRLLLEEPGEVCALLGVASVVTLILGWHWRYRKMIWAAGCGAGLMALVYLLSVAVTTTREELMDSTRALVANTAPADWPAVRAMLDDDVSLHGPDGRVWLKNNRMLGELEDVLQQRVIQSQDVLEVRAVVEGPDSGRTLLNLKTIIGFQYGTGPVKTLWMIRWRRDGEGQPWQAVEVHWLNHNDPNGIKPRYGIWR